jgi:DNA-directed RNA polymerase specialized sigma24 family protein
MTIPVTQNERPRITDAQVRAALADGDQTAWPPIIEAFTGYLWSVLTQRYAIDAARIDDLIQDTWLIAWSRRAQFGRDGRYSTGALINWLCSIARNQMIDDYRRQQRIRMITSADTSAATWAVMWADRADDEPGPEPLALLAARHDQARALLSVAAASLSASEAGALPFLVVDHPSAQQMGEPARRARAMRAYGHRDRGGAIEMAAHLGITRSAAKSRAARARVVGRRAICRSLGLPVTATLADVLAAVELGRAAARGLDVVTQALDGDA